MSLPRFFSTNRRKLSRLTSSIALVVAVSFTSGSTAITSKIEEGSFQLSQVLSQNQAQQWRRMTAEERSQAWEYILNSPMGVAALNQLAVEGFISPSCPKTFYLNEEFGGFQTLLRVKCPDARGVSAAVGYDEIRVIFNRFESNIENFEIERVYPQEGRPPKTNLPD
ncbi:MAG: hypothetical protein WA919_07380 [Coleofasciculaceae cyanobacterium]